MTTTKAKKPSRLTPEIMALADEMHANGTMEDASYSKITMRDLNKAENRAKRRDTLRKLAAHDQQLGLE